MNVQLLDDLIEEQTVLDDLVAQASPRSWSRATPAEGWTVADSIRHLLISDRAAIASLRLGRDPLDAERSPPSVEGQIGVDLLGLWRTTRAELTSAFAEHDDRDRVPWGGRDMSVRSLATARLMECWAHGLDCFAALGTETKDTDRLAHIAWLGWKTLPYAFIVAGIDPPAPPGTLRLELVSPAGLSWNIGPDDGGSWIRGGAGDWCRLVTHRLRAAPTAPMVGVGELAEASLLVGRAFL